MAVNLTFEEKAERAIPLKDRIDLVIGTSVVAGGIFTQIETDDIMNYALLGAAMEYTGSVNDTLVDATNIEIQYWEKMDLNTLRAFLR